MGGRRLAVRCPVPFYTMHANSPAIRGLELTDGEAVMAFPLERNWLRPGVNRLTLHVEGARQVYYDWIAFGTFQ